MIEDKNSNKSLNQVGMNLCKCLFCGKHSGKSHNQTITKMTNSLDNNNNNAYKDIDNDGNNK